jgi:WD40 repeat protein
METTQYHYIKHLQTLRGHSQPIYGIIFDGEYLYTSSADKHVVRWSLETGEQTNFVVKLENSAYNLAYAKNFNLLVIGESTGDLHVIDMIEKKEIRLLQQHRSSIFALIYDEKTNRFYSGDRDGVFCVWSAENFDLIYAEHFHCERIKDIAIHPEEDIVAFCAMDGKVRILKSETFELLKEIKVSDYSLSSVLFDGDYFFTGGKTAFISRWNWKTGIRFDNQKMHAYAVYDLAFLNDKKYVISASFDKTINLWQREGLKFLDSVNHTRDGHRSSVNKICILSDKKFATISDDRKIKIWEVEEN